MFQARMHGINRPCKQHSGGMVTLMTQAMDCLHGKHALPHISKCTTPTPLLLSHLHKQSLLDTADPKLQDLGP
jgi:hypothetical protein